MSNFLWPHRRQPSRLPHPWDSPGKNTGVGCHFLFQCTKVESESEVTQWYPTLSDPMDCSLPGSSIHGVSRQEYWSGLPLPSPLYGKALNIDSTSALSFPKHNKHQVRYLQNFTSLRLSRVNWNAKEIKIQNKKSVLIEPNIILLPKIFPTTSPLSLPTRSYPLCWACPVFQALDHLLIL